MSEEAKLTERQRRFAEEYARLGNGTQAARAAGYSGVSESSLTVQASRLLANANVCELIAKLGEVKRNERVMSRQEREELLSAFARGEEGCEPRDRLKALDQLSKMNADYLERREHSGPGGGPIAQTHQVVIARGDVVRIARGKGEGK